MKILHINTYSSGGAATAAIRLHEALLLQGYDSHFLFLKGTKKIRNGHYWNLPIHQPVQKKSFQNKVHGYFKKLIRAALPDFFFLPKRHTEKPVPKIEIFTSPVTPFAIEEHQMVKGADVIQLHWVADFLNWNSFFKNIDKPIFWYFHDMNPILGGLHYNDDLTRIKDSNFQNKEIHYNQIKENSILHAKNLRVQCDSNWLTKETLRSGRFSSAKSVDTIHYSLDFARFYPLEKENVKKILGIDSNYTVILFGCENLQNKRKGLRLLIRALNSIEEKENLILCTFGSGIDLLNETGGKFKIKNFGKIYSLDIQRMIYSAADFFIIPSLQEAFGQTALESLACGTPVIGFNTGGIPDIIENEVNGLLVENITSEDLKGEILRLIADKYLLNKLTQASRKSVEIKFSQEKQVKAFLKLYEKD